jgi:hypothetical protein
VGDRRALVVLDNAPTDLVFLTGLLVRIPLFAAVTFVLVA